MIGFPGQQQTGGVAAAGHAEAAAGFVEVAVDRMLRDAQTAGDLLGMEMLGDQAKAFPLTRSQPFYRRRVVTLPHERGGKCSLRLSSIPLVSLATIRQSPIGPDTLAE